MIAHPLAFGITLVISLVITFLGFRSAFRLREENARLANRDDNERQIHVQRLKKFFPKDTPDQEIADRQMGMLADMVDTANRAVIRFQKAGGDFALTARLRANTSWRLYQEWEERFRSQKLVVRASYKEYLTL